MRRYFCLITLILSFTLVKDWFVLANTTYHPLSQANPFTQDWTDIGLIVSSDNWNNVPSIIGYMGEMGYTTDNIDPQTVLIEYVTTNLIPNLTNTGNTNGGVAEFHITNPVVAIQGSGSRDHPNLDIRINSTSCNQTNEVIAVQYNLRDIDDTADNAVQRVALQYRVGSTGNYTNIPAGYVADATTGPNEATLVTPVNVSLPNNAKGQTQLHIRVITSNAAGSDEWVGVDDIRISCIAPTSASAEISGRVVTADGRGIAGAVMTIEGGSLEQSKTLITNPFGYYRFDGLEVGQTYILTVGSKRYMFSKPSRVVELLDNISDFNIVAEP